jgi:hypothetical protein
MNVFGGNALADEVEINLNMHVVLMQDEIGGEVDDSDTDAVDQSGPRHLMNYVTGSTLCAPLSRSRRRILLWGPRTHQRGGQCLQVTREHVVRHALEL